MSVFQENSMNRLERLYAINEELRRRSPLSVSATRLAEEFGVTRRTVERDLAALRASGVPVDADVGRRGGYRLARARGNAVFSLSPEEVVALLLAARAANGMPFTTAASTATQRLLDALPDATRVGVEELRVRIRAGRLDVPRARPAVQRAIEAAVRDRLVVQIDYVDANAVKTARAVEAHGFYGAIDGWYLVGWCRLRDAGRIFRLDRIARATVTREQASVRDLDDVLGWVPNEVVQP
jgi:predicted DNA-binding transcriptional regulator YafY